MRKLLKSWVFWCFVVPIASLPLLVSWRNEQKSYECRCVSARLEGNGRLDVAGAKVFRGPRRLDREIESDLWKLLGQEHVHDYFWHGHQVFVGSDGRRFTGACPICLERHLSSICLESPPFLAWLKTEHGAGRISSRDLESELPRSWPEGQFPFGWKP